MPFARMLIDSEDVILSEQSKTRKDFKEKRFIGRVKLVWRNGRQGRRIEDWTQGGINHIKCPLNCHMKTYYCIIHTHTHTHSKGVFKWSYTRLGQQ